MSKKEFLSGLIAAPFTPMNGDGTLNSAKIKEYAEYLIERNMISGVFICGTTGESASLTTEERKIVAEKWVEAAKGRLKIVVHVGGTSIVQSTDLAAHAQAIGADATAAMAPYFFKPATVDDLISFFEPVAAAAGQLPFYYYNMPSITGVSLSVPEFLTKARTRIPNLKGVKFTHNNLMEMQQCLHIEGFEVLHGFDEILITGLAAGATSAVGSTYNYVPGIYRQIMDAMAKGDLDTARKMQWESVKILDVVIRHGGGVRGGKIAMSLAGIECGQCRLPVAQCSAEEREQMREELEKTEFFNYI